MESDPLDWRQLARIIMATRARLIDLKNQSADETTLKVLEDIIPRLMVRRCNGGD